jgi:methyltransferase FkbM-like protein
MLKIDAEGSDLEILRGARTALAASPDPIVVVELWTEFEPERTLESLRAEGFELHLIAGDGELRRVGMEEALDAGSTVTYMNVALRRP